MMDCTAGPAARSCALIGHPFTAGKAVVFSANQDAIDDALNAWHGAGNPGGECPATPVFDPAAELDRPTAHGHGLDAEAGKARLRVERGLDCTGGSSQGDADRGLLAQAARRTAEPGAVHAPDP